MRVSCITGTCTWRIQAQPVRRPASRTKLRLEATCSSAATVNGNDSWFDSTAGVLAKGGTGATLVSAAATAGAGASGSTTGCIGDTLLAGGNGATAAGAATSSGAGGGGAGSTGA